MYKGRKNENEKPEKNKSESEEEREEDKQDDDESVSCARRNLISVILPTWLSRIITRCSSR